MPDLLQQLYAVVYAGLHPTVSIRSQDFWDRDTSVRWPRQRAWKLCYSLNNMEPLSDCTDPQARTGWAEMCVRVDIWGWWCCLDLVVVWRGGGLSAEWAAGVVVGLHSPFVSWSGRAYQLGGQLFNS